MVDAGPVDLAVGRPVEQSAGGQIDHLVDLPVSASCSCAVTILTTRGPLATKTIEAGLDGLPLIRPYDNARVFSVSVVPVDGMRALARLVRALLSPAAQLHHSRRALGYH